MPGRWSSSVGNRRAFVFLGASASALRGLGESEGAELDALGYIKRPMPVEKPEPCYFATPDSLRKWFRDNHNTAEYLWVGYYKKGTGKASVTWPESVDEALCYGWIDGIRKRVGGERYTIRFTPRRPGSNWSKANIERVAALEASGRMRAAGRKAFERRHEGGGVVGYSYEDVHRAELTSAQMRRLRANKEAWAFFKKQARWYQRGAVHWITSAKRDATREKRLQTLIDCSALVKTIPPLTRK